MSLKPFVFEVDFDCPVAVFEAVHDRGYVLFLDSSDRAHPLGQYSFVTFDPLEVVTDGTFDAVGERLSAYGFVETVEGLPPFQGGAAGVFGYDLGRVLEGFPERAAHVVGVPDMAVGIYDFVAAFDHVAESCVLIVQAMDIQAADRRKAEVLAVIGEKVDVSEYVGGDVEWVSDKSQMQYERDVQRVIDYILAGDVYQVNLAQRFSAELPKKFSSWDHYKALRCVNSAPFGGYMNLGDVQIVSCSPERFLTVSDGVVETRPIKGTLPVSIDSSVLEESEKDRAENVMIVDLLRNDLSKVCDADSVEVPELCVLERFASVYHLVSTVKGRLRKGVAAIDVLKACFPGGSITGAPKIRAMEIIEELETFRRGAYCGTMGYIGFDGTMDSNILIRTLVYHGGKVTVSAGGGVTAASDPAAEYAESLSKVKVVLDSFDLTEILVRKSD